MSHLDEDTGVLLLQERHLEYNNKRSDFEYRQALPVAALLGENCVLDVQQADLT